MEKIAVIGMGYVGLPLAIELATKFDVIGFDIDKDRIDELKLGEDRTKEVSGDTLNDSTIVFASSTAVLEKTTCFIVAVPTPINDANYPDLEPLRKASALVGKTMAPGSLVIYESTVYPGATEEVCVPILEEKSGLTYNQDFFCGYSPERINPGRNAQKISEIVKVVSGSNQATAARVKSIYDKVITAGTHLASSIKVAEAAKVIENTQRDINIALANELSLIFDKLGIDTHEVLDAAATKWNFVKYTPGLVGGHCIGVDPYYLTFKAQSLGYHPELILSGRRLNDDMPKILARKFIRQLNAVGDERKKVLVLGFAFKENCPDIRNTKVKSLIDELIDYGVDVDVHDPLVRDQDVENHYGFELTHFPPLASYNGIILAVPHDEFVEAGVDEIKKYGKKRSIFFDLKAVFPENVSDLRA